MKKNSLVAIVKKNLVGMPLP